MSEDAQEYIGCGITLLLIAVAVTLALWAIKLFTELIGYRL